MKTLYRANWHFKPKKNKLTKSISSVIMANSVAHARLKMKEEVSLIQNCNTADVVVTKVAYE
jgi:hypothetical protein